MIEHPHTQSQYQVRFDWDVPGTRAVGTGADVIVWVDALTESAMDASGQSAPPDAVLASFRNRRAVAEWVLARQGDRGDRFTVAVVAAGEPRDDGSIRFALEDLLAAGALIDALADLGIDYCSPEAAAASAAFTGLRHALGPLVGASATGHERALRSAPDALRHATDLDASSEVLTVREWLGAIERSR